MEGRGGARKPDSALQMATPISPGRRFTPTGRPGRRPCRIAMRLSSISSRSDVGEFYVVERPPGRPSKYMSLQECMQSRPSVRLDLEGPTPCTYTVKPPYSNIPGGRINRLSRYTRGKLPYPNTEAWTHNVCITGKSPTPCSYTTPKSFGHPCPVKRQAPSYSISARNYKSLARPHSDKEPSPTSYDRVRASEAVLTHFPSFTIGCRRDLKTSGTTPGPAHYHPKDTNLFNRSPAFSMRGRTATV